MTAVLAIAIVALGFVAGTGLYDSATGRNRSLLRQSLTMGAWLIALWAFCFSHVGS